ncbi:FxSxx-COOH system tetratricopeptide repeat protein [Micromonospora sp. NPDC047793]|uniref:FxSxx-COOH system tetratricopeptide repeat protein n=1 Tax=Micromonospora sp. NPDC047793 TaxID=3154342 RepID=UPI0033E9D9FB
MIVKDPLIVPSVPAPLTVSFLAPASNTGRTSVVANLAWLFARHGRDTLVLDLSAEGAPVHDYLYPLLSEEVRADQVLAAGAADLLDTASPDGAVARRYAAGPGRLDVIRTDAFDVGTAAALRGALRDTAYANVLVDASTGSSPRTLAAIAAFSDRVAVCVNPQSGNVREGARLAADLAVQRVGTLPMVVVASQFGGDPEQEERSRGEIYREFASLHVDGSVPLLTLPPQPYFDYLALLKEPAGSDVRKAYARLASALVPDDPVPPIDVPSSLSNRYVTAMDHKAGSMHRDHTGGSIRIFYHPTDQLRMEWLTRQLVNNGIDVDLVSATATATATATRPGDGPSIVLASPACDVASPAPAGELVVVALPGSVLPVGGPSYAVVDLTDEPTPTSAAGRLFGALCMTGLAAELTGGSRRLFAAPNHINGLPARDVPFVGRDEEIDQLRETFTRAGHQMVVVRAVSGMGKTALIREYYERFGADYDTVWWIPSHDLRAVRRSLAELGDDLAVRPRGDVVAATIEVLGRDTPPDDASPPGRWLLVFDGVGDLAELDGLVPTGGNGHVLITTQNPAEPATGSVLPLGPLAHKDVVEGLIRVVGDATVGQVVLTESDAGRVADAVRAVPIGVRLAHTYLVQVLTGRDPRLAPGSTVAEREELLAAALDAVCAAATSAPGFGNLLERVLELLHRDPYGRRARHLAEICAFLSPSGVDLRLLRAPAVLARLWSETDSEITGDDIDRTIWTGAAVGLFSVRWLEFEPLRTVPALQRMLLDRMSPDEQAERRSQVRQALAGVANALPWDADIRMRTPEAKWTSSIYAELQRHVAACGALEDDDPAVREWMVRQFRYLVRTADQDHLRHARPLLAASFDRWHQAYPEDLLTLRLANELTNALRALGLYREALKLDMQMLREFSGLLGRDHFRILVVHRGIAANQRALGQFDRALAISQMAEGLFADTHGPEHPETLTARHNLAVSQSLAGQMRRALDTERAVLSGRRRLLGDTGRQTLWSEMEIGIYTRELGDFIQAATTLLMVDRRMQAAKLPRQHTLRLRARRHWAIASRLSRAGTDWRGALDQVLRAYEDLFGPDHPQSWATRLSLAAEKSDDGDQDRAAELAHSVVAYCDVNLGSHPFTAGARTNLAVYLLRAGSDADAVRQAQQGHEELLDLLGEPHPWTIGALLGRVLVEAQQHRHAVAKDLADEAYDLATQYLAGVPRHPCVSIAEEWRRRLRADEMVDPLLDWPSGCPRYLEITIPET